jgi:hypothetical protein
MPVRLKRMNEATGGAEREAPRLVVTSKQI